MNNKIDKDLLREMLEHGVINLKNNCQIVNDLNVFPIPDGDTGENMFQTFKGGYDSIANEDYNGVGEMLLKFANNSILNARGNSGVILSQLIYGIAFELKNENEISLLRLVQALSSGVKYGYRAVEKPVEGTMLTVARETSEFLNEIVFEGLEITEFFEVMYKQIKSSVDNTTEKLEVLKNAGVVDSGGAGLFYIIEGFVKLLRGETLNSEQDLASPTVELDFSKFDENSVLEFGYCSEVLVRLQNSKIKIQNFDMEKVKEYLNTIGNSIVTVLNGTILKIHVHTFEPYKLLQYCQTFGEFLKVKIENMTLQSKETTIQNQFTRKKIEGNRKKYAVVTVASGQGVIDMFENFGVDVVIDGGQTNNPSVEDFIDAFNKINAETIFVLPNNSNIVMSAKQAGVIYKNANIVVINTKNIGEGYSAITMLDLNCNDVDEIINQINGEIEKTCTAMISTAIRDAVYDNVNVIKGQSVGILGKNILSCSINRDEIVFDLLSKVDTSQYCCLILIFGKNMILNEILEIKNQLQQTYKNLEIYEIDGKQDIYDLYLILN